DHAWLQIEIRDRDGEVEGSISRDGLVQVEEDARDRRPGGDLDRLRAIGLRRLSHREKLRSALGIRGPGGAMSLEEIGEDRDLVRLGLARRRPPESPADPRLVRVSAIGEDPRGEDASRLDVGRVVEENESLLRDVRTRAL